MSIFQSYLIRKKAKCFATYTAKLLCHNTHPFTSHMVQIQLTILYMNSTIISRHYNFFDSYQSPCSPSTGKQGLSSSYYFQILIHRRPTQSTHPRQFADIHTPCHKRWVMLIKHRRNIILGCGSVANFFPLALAFSIPDRTLALIIASST